MIVLQLLALTLVIPLELGPLGRSTHWGTPDLLLVGVWAFSWLNSYRAGITWGIVGGLVRDILSFLPFGVWLVSLLCLCTITNWVKGRFFTDVSGGQAIGVLAVLSLSERLLIGLIAQNLDLTLIATGIVADCLVGIVVFYFVGSRFNIFQQWLGQRLTMDE